METRSQVSKATICDNKTHSNDNTNLSDLSVVPFLQHNIVR
jgi:hypothetical protein